MLLLKNLRRSGDDSCEMAINHVAHQLETGANHHRA
jgi:hypothetical protein